MIRLPLVGVAALERLVRELVPLLARGDVVLLEGPVGAGKTTLVAAAARTLGVDAAVGSPTYTIAHRYETADGGSISHVDLYRSRDDPEAAAADLEPYLDAGRAFIEWPTQALASLLEGRSCWTLQLDHAGPAARTIGIGPPARVTTAEAIALAGRLLAATTSEPASS